jgi:hypothetical protein
MNRKSLLAALVLAGFAGDALAQGTTATLLDGTVLTIKEPLEIYLTEGSVWNLDPVTATFTAVGQKVTIPATVDGVAVTIGGTSYLAADGTQAAVTAGTIDRLLDSNASLRDLNAGFAGPVRSLFSTVENRRVDALAPVTRDANAQAMIESNYFSYVEACYPAHAAVLPADYLQKAGYRNGGMEYPAVSGGTLKSAGHVYTDTAGNEYLIPDTELVVELAENVLGGNIRSINPGNGADIPPSMVIGDMLVIMNQDPRFAQEVLGLGLTSLPHDLLFQQQNLGMEVAIGGYSVGEHVLFGITFEAAALVDPAAPLLVSPTTWIFKNNKDEIRIKGTTSYVDNVELVAQILGEEFNMPLVADLAGGVFSFKTKGDVNVPDVTEVTIVARDTQTGAILSSETYLRSEVQ